MLQLAEARIYEESSSMAHGITSFDDDLSEFLLLRTENAWRLHQTRNKKEVNAAREELERAGEALKTVLGKENCSFFDRYEAALLALTMMQGEGNYIQGLRDGFKFRTLLLAE